MDKKYIDAEKLIAEIERRIDSWKLRGEHSPEGQGKDTCVSRVTELTDLLSFITSPQQEQPSLPSNIDEAAEKYSENILANNEDLQDAIEDAFKEGAKWMVEHGETEVELEKEIERIVKDEERFMKFQVKEQLIKYVARHFAEWGATHLNNKEKAK